MKQGTLIAIIAVLILGGVVVYFMSNEDVMDEQAQQDEQTNTEDNTNNTNSGQNNSGSGTVEETNRVVLAPTETGNTVTVAQATLDADGYAVIYKVDSNGKTTVIGNSNLLEAGTHTDILIQLDSVIAQDQTVVAVLHADDGNGEFDFPEADFYLESDTQAIVSDVDIVDVPQEDEAVELQAQVETYLENNM